MFQTRLQKKMTATMKVSTSWQESCILKGFTKKRNAKVHGTKKTTIKSISKQFEQDSASPSQLAAVSAAHYPNTAAQQEADSAAIRVAH